MKILNESNFKSEIGSGYSLVEFHSKHCAPCRIMGRALKKIEERVKDNKLTICKNDVDESDVSESYDIEYLPTTIFFKDGKEVNRAVGCKTTREIRSFIAESLMMV